MTSLNKNARVAGLLYVLFGAFGIVRLIYIPSALIVDGNPDNQAVEAVLGNNLRRMVSVLV